MQWRLTAVFINTVIRFGAFSKNITRKNKILVDRNKTFGNLSKMTVRILRSVTFYYTNLETIENYSIKVYEKIVKITKKYLKC